MNHECTYWQASLAITDNRSIMFFLKKNEEIMIMKEEKYRFHKH